ncbi:MAG: monooxygenase, partial [Bacteroidia bacterium]
IFKKLGIHKKNEKAGNIISSMKITDEKFNHLTVADLSKYEQKYEVHTIAIHRGELQKILVNELGYEHISLSKRLSKIENLGHFKLSFEDHSSIESKFLIGADGIKSVVRNQLFEKSFLRNANQICWRGVCELDLPNKYHHEANEAWGKGKRFGFVKISDRKVYWYALINAKNTKADGVILHELFKEFHPDILQIINATNKEQIINNEIADLKPIHRWHIKNACVIGDAAHATTPNLGQGACQAIEDAYILGKLLDSGISLQNCFEQYEKLRKKKVQKVVNTSWTLGQISHWENPISIWIRNTILRLTPPFLSQKQFDEIFEINS